jgi:hypothetical protein
VTGGRNGYGAKLANIFSTKFVVETCDGKRGRRYKQAFSKNMSKKGEAQIRCACGRLLPAVLAGLVVGWVGGWVRCGLLLTAMLAGLPGKA